MFLMKTKRIFFWLACLAWTLSSCLKTEDPITIELTKNCQIKTFTLSSDSVPGLSSVAFTIDQLSGEIFNLDSLPVGTKIEKVLCTLTVASSYDVSGVEVTPYAMPDSTRYLSSLSDSIDFSEPVKIVMHAYDGISTKTYLARVNIHQVNPDTMIWAEAANPLWPVAVREQKTLVSPWDESRLLSFVRPVEGKGYQLFEASVSDPSQWNERALAGLPETDLRLAQMATYNKELYVTTSEGTLYRSSDGASWRAVAQAPSIRILMGEIEEGTRQAGALAVAAEVDGQLTFCAMNKEGQWSTGAPVPESFPRSGFTPFHYESMYHHYLMVAGGRTGQQLLNTTWSTPDGLAWEQMASGEVSFTRREGAMVTTYDDQLWLIGGLDSDRKGLKDLYRSIDRGVTWTLVDSLVVLPEAFEGRGFSSVTVDKENCVNLFGGKANGEENDLNQLWRGRINRLIPKQ